MINKLSNFKDISPSLPGPPTEASNGLKFVTAAKTDVAGKLSSVSPPKIPDIPKPQIPQVSIPSVPNVPNINTPSLPNVSNSVPPLPSIPKPPTNLAPKVSAPNFSSKHFNPNGLAKKSVDRLTGAVSNISSKVKSVASSLSSAVPGAIGGGVAGGLGSSLSGVSGAATGGALGGAAGSVAGPVGSVGGAVGGSMAASKAFDVAAGANAAQRKAMATANRQRQSGGALTGIGGKTTFDTKKGTMTTGAGSQKRTVTLGKTSVVTDPKTGKQEVGHLAYKGGKAVYKRAADPSTLAQTSSNPLERVGRSLFAGAYKKQDQAQKQKALEKARQSDAKRQKDLGVKLKPGG